jgi:hypothetical protein
MVENKNPGTLGGLSAANRLVMGVLKAAVILVFALISLRGLFESDFPELVRWLKPLIGILFLIWTMVAIRKKNNHGS